jgi:hypothetical protein
MRRRRMKDRTAARFNAALTSLVAGGAILWPGIMPEWFGWGFIFFFGLNLFGAVASAAAD